MAIKPFNIYSRQQHAREQQIRAVQVNDTAIHIETLIRPAGEATFTLEFPIHFTQKPSVSFGWEMDEATVLRDSDFPDCSAYVLRWEEKNTPDIGSFTLYAGARMGVRIAFKNIDLAPSAGMVLHSRFEGRAIQPPDRGDLK